MNKTKERLKGFVIGVLVMAILTTTVVVMANTGVARTVFYGVNIVVNGVAWNPPADQRPFISDGRTFLPVRGIAEVLGEQVEWDGTTQTVYIGNIPRGVLRNPLWQAAPPFEGTNTRLQNATMLGNAYTNSLVGSGFSQHNLNGQFTTLTGTIGRRDGSFSSTPTTITFIGDGREIVSFDIDENTRPRDISVNVRGVLVLRIEMSINFGTNVQVFTNMIIE